MAQPLHTVLVLGQPGDGAKSLLAAVETLKVPHFRFVRSPPDDGAVDCVWLVVDGTLPTADKVARLAAFGPELRRVGVAPTCVVLTKADLLDMDTASIVALEQHLNSEQWRAATRGYMRIAVSARKGYNVVKLMQRSVPSRTVNLEAILKGATLPETIERMKAALCQLQDLRDAGWELVERDRFYQFTLWPKDAPFVELEMRGKSV